MYLLRRMTSTLILVFFFYYSEVTVATRSGPYPAQMITAVTRSSPYPDQMVDHHLETTSTALNVSGDQGTKMSPRDRSPMRTSSPRQPSGKDHRNQWNTYADFAAVGTNYWFVWPEGNCPPDWAWFLPRFFLHSVTDGVLVPCRCRLWLA